MRPIPADELSTLVGRNYDCAVEPGPWPETLAAHGGLTAVPPRRRTSGPAGRATSTARPTVLEIDAEGDGPGDDLGGAVHDADDDLLVVRGAAPSPHHGHLLT